MELYVWPSDFDLLSFDFECLQFLAACKFCALPIKIVHTSKPSISPSKELPYFKIEDNTAKKIDNITEFPKFVEYARKCAFQIVLDSELTATQKSEVDTYFSFLKKTLHPAIIHSLWNDESNYSALTHKWYSSKMSFPKNFFYLERRVASEREYLKAKNLSTTEIIKTAMRTITQLSNKLGDKKYFFGDKPSSLDALIFGYLAPLLKLPLPSDRLQIHLQACSNLVRFIESIISIYLVIPEEQKKVSDEEKKFWESRKAEAQKEAEFKKQRKQEEKCKDELDKESSIKDVVIFGVGAVVLSIIFAVHTGIVVIDTSPDD
uniref:GST C-terminal domain-containing protein n=1 Tax=Parastrongyloides trichosuri TaxID=131310 RepID=A0A0N4ZMG4_PARTI